MATLYRWRQQGLEVLLVGGTPYTSHEALVRFFRERTEARAGGGARATPSSFSRRASPANGPPRHEMGRPGNANAPSCNRLRIVRTDHRE